MKGKPVKKALVYTKNEHTISLEKIDSDALRIVSQLRNYGFDAYIVGGAVRDLLLDKDPKDFDIVTDATPSKIKKIFRNSRIIGKRFRLVHVFFGSKIFEVSTFRSISNGTVGNNFGTIGEDVQRRDFTLNALYYDPLKEQIIDYVGGVDDIKRKVVRPVIPLDHIFVEDPVRMLRAVKYAATTGFHMPLSLRRKIRKSVHLMSPVSPSRLTEELLKIMNSGHAYEIIKLAMDVDLYMYLQPGASAMIYADSNFSKKYFANIQEMDLLHSRHPEARLGVKLTYMIHDFIASLTNWEKELKSNYSANEIYSKVWSQCRTFVLPMNPQRTELEFAVNSVLKSFGMAVHPAKKKKPVSKPKGKIQHVLSNEHGQKKDKKIKTHKGGGGVSSSGKVAVASNGVMG